MRQVYLLFLSVLLLPLYALTYSAGPPAARTGAPGESTCQQGCHRSFALNAGPGSLSITTSATYAPGDTLEITVAVQQSGAARRGFELTVKDTTGNVVGTLELVEPEYTQFRGTGNRYVSHTLAGTGRQSWTVRWRAPDAEVGPVTFYAAGVAANGDGSNQGDYVYTTFYTVQPQTTWSLSTQLPEVLGMFDVYPRPAYGPVNVVYEVTRATTVTLTLFDLLGRRIGVLYEGERAPGTYRILLPQDVLAPGLYWCVLQTPQGSSTRPILVQR